VNDEVAEYRACFLEYTGKIFLCFGKDAEKVEMWRIAVDYPEAEWQLAVE
jgi:hypothetical protein